MLRGNHVTKVCKGREKESFSLSVASSVVTHALQLALQCMVMTTARLLRYFFLSFQMTHPSFYNSCIRAAIPAQLFHLLWAPSALSRWLRGFDSIFPCPCWRLCLLPCGSFALSLSFLFLPSPKDGLSDFYFNCCSEVFVTNSRPWWLTSSTIRCLQGEAQWMNARLKPWTPLGISAQNGRKGRSSQTHMQWTSLV